MTATPVSSWTIVEAQRDVQTVFRRGWVGQLVSGLVWTVSAALGTFVSPTAGILALVLGGMTIFLLTQLALTLLGGPASLRKGNPLNALAMQIAFTVPLAMPVIGGAALYRLDWFYPAFLIIVGAHYLPFIFLYGMPAFGVLAAAMLGSGVFLGMYGPRGVFPLGGWVGAALLLAFALYAWMTWKQQGAKR